ncbi:hypothetical protein [Crocosphaera sp.]|uniref:hypothetical protein n=1 Tax=Crocosphaera sp. TaxID=2729996 RepID=UPI00260F7F67|nr:hypothetical protein [Crocosphaera sp.]MDJ0580055.1 hypothetical protein [Crocosphaera sp.]
MDKKIILQIIGGSFQEGFSVIVQISKRGQSLQSNYQGKLPGNMEIMSAYQQWQNDYYLSPMIRSAGIRNPRIKLSNELTEVVSENDYINSQENLQTMMKNWLDSRDFREIKEHICDEVNKDESAQLIITTNNVDLQRLPWQTWNLFKRRTLIEVSFSSANFYH